MSDNLEIIKTRFEENIEAKKDFLNEIKNIDTAVSAILSCYKKGGKILICGNGGSAADSQHIAGELVGRFKLERNALDAIALSTDSSILTALPNDYDFSIVFARQVEAHAREGDILIALSTSGNSINVIKAIEKAKELGVFVISMTGGNGGKIKEMSDININSSSKETPRIQECHQLAYHIICELVEKKLFG